MRETSSPSSAPKKYIACFHPKPNTDRVALFASHGYSLIEAKDSSQVLEVLHAYSQLEAIFILEELCFNRSIQQTLELSSKQLHIPVICLSQSSMGYSQRAFPEFICVPADIQPNLLILALETIIKAQKVRLQSPHRPRAHPLGNSSILHYRFHNLDDCYTISAQLAALFPQPKITQLGIMELMINAIEHGNLGMSAEEKRSFKTPVEWKEAIDARLRSEPYKDITARLECYQSPSQIQILIHDEGQGFDYESIGFMETNSAKNGRGILVARQLSFDNLYYLNGGKTAVAIVYR